MKRLAYYATVILAPSLGYLSLLSCISAEEAREAVSRGAEAAAEAAARGADPLTVVLVGAGGALAGILGGVCVGRKRPKNGS